MSALLLRWLNDDIKVHRKVEVLERDASNGYIIAEVLHLQGLEPKFETYEKSSSTAAKIHNMELLGQKFEALGVPFPVNTRRAIMMEDRSSVLQFMLQLKDFLNRRQKGRPESAKAKMIPSEQSAKTQLVTTNSNLPPRDVEERFVMETTNTFHPKDIRFDKDIDMAVHLRKFQQAQWQAENELDDFQQKNKANTNASSAAGYSSTRAHLQEKAKFMRDWDREHHEKWKHTQRIYLAAERDDLRLELTLEARRQIYAETKLADSQQDAAAGVVEFEKNMNRLGLASSGAEQSLRAIPANDAGALVLLRSLEKRVEDLDFRPSNNVKMMKELRKRRKAQLAAEKDRRMRRQKALADQKKSIEAHKTGPLQVNNLDDKRYPLTTDDNDLQEQTTESENFVDPREKYLEDKRPELEENYARLRESGSAKREENMKVLEELRSAKRKKEYLRAWNDCSDVVDGLISLAVAIVVSSDRDTLDIEPMKKQFFLELATSQPTLSGQGGQEMRYELDASINNFLSSSEEWATLPLQSRLTTYDVKTDIQALAAKWASPTEPLNTTWRRPASFVFLSVFTEDQSGIEIARRVSTEHDLEFLQLEPLLDECVKMSYDHQKLGDQVASLSDRERGLGAFGMKISGLRQKNAPVPEALAVEIIAKAVSLCRREALSFSSEDAANIPPNGCMLHNFPRTLEEAKLLEKAILADLSGEEGDQINPASYEGSSGTPEESTVPVIISAWDCVVSMSPHQAPLLEQVEADKNLQASDSSPSISDKRRPSSSKMVSSENQRKLALDEDQRVRNEEQKTNLEVYWSQSTRHIQIKRTELHRDVLVEIIHLSIDVYTQTAYKTIPAVIECGVNILPDQVKEELNARREAMSLVDRLMWMKASKEIDLEDDGFAKLLEKLQKVDESLQKKIREPMAAIRSVIQAVSALAVTVEQDLESELFSGTDPFQALLDQAATKLKSMKGPPKHELRERFLTELEVSLGDMADSNRVAGNNFVDALAQDPFPEVISAVDIVYQCLPSICLFLKDYAMQKIELLRAQLYDHVPFLSESLQDSGRKVVLSKMFAQEAMSAASELGGDKAGGGELAQFAGEDVLNILSQVALEYSFQLADEPPAQQYTLSETNVTTVEITRLLQQVTLLCRFADRLRQMAGQLYASDLRRLQQTVQDDIHTKDKAIAETMTAIRRDGCASWPIRDLELSSISTIATRLPRLQRENFLTAPQLAALVHTFENWELSDPIAAGAFGGTAIASDVFVALVLEVAAKADFPLRWKDASAVAAVTLQQRSNRGAVSWRKFVWSLLCIQFTGIPSLEDILAYEQRVLKLPATKRQCKVDDDHCNILLSQSDFWQLPLWFEKQNNQGGYAEKLKDLVFRLFATPTDSKEAGEIPLLSMLLCWCVHTSCSFNVRHELEEFAPQYPRGLFRVFHLLQQHSIAHTTQCISSLFTVSGLSQQPLSLASFTWFHHESPADLQRFFILQNPLEALVQL